VPADGQLLASDGLRVDQSTLTGEPHPAFKLPVDTNQRELVPRLERRELLFAGTAVAAGRGTCVVTATGMATEIGRIAHLTQAVAEEPSPLQREMAQVTRLVTALALALGVGFLVLGTATGLLRLTDGLVFALGVIVANVPEGLLPTLTLALALAVQRLARRRSLVKRLSAVEALGAITVICSDKTGTLTEGRMTARALWVAGRTIALDDTPARAPEASGLLEAAALASNATAERGDPTEVALLAAAVGLGLDPERVRADRPVLATYSFDSFRKRMTLTRADGPDAVAYIKGAPKETLALCATIRWDGTVVPLTEERRQALLSDHDRLAAQGLRLLAVAERPLPRELVGAPERQVERELTFLGLVALWDPPRPEVAEAVALCARAGIRTVIVTGDYGLTAQAIARQVGMRVDKVVTGEETERMRPETLRGLVREPGALFGGLLEHAYRSAVTLTFGGGVNEVQRDIIAMAGLGLPRSRR